MKTIFTFLVLFAAFAASAQCQHDTTKTPITGYLSYGVSMTNTNDYRTSSYTGLEGGICYSNLSLGAMLGRSSIKALGTKNDNINQYFYEITASVSKPIGDLSGSLFVGYGGYFNTSHMFIEYGVEMDYVINKFSYGVSCSNWDGITYITPSITFNF